MKFICFDILLLSGLFNLNAAAQINNDSVFNKKEVQSFYLTQPANNNKKDLLKESSKPLRLFVFLSPECPLCRRYSSVLVKLYEQFWQDVEFYGIIPGKAYSADDVRKFRDEYKIIFRLLIDENKTLSNYLKASATPEVILLNRYYEMVYKGAIDNLLEKFGKQRIKATEDFLNRAILQSLQKQKVTVKRTKAVGCRINDY